jgi:hypothetical protein
MLTDFLASDLLSRCLDLVISSLADRSQAFALAGAGLLPTTVVLDMVASYSTERDFAVLDALAGNLALLRAVFDEGAGSGHSTHRLSPFLCSSASLFILCSAHTDCPQRRSSMHCGRWQHGCSGPFWRRWA